MDTNRPLELRRAIGVWEGLDTAHTARMASRAALAHLLNDARADIIKLHTELAKARALLEVKNDPDQP